MGKVISFFDGMRNLVSGLGTSKDKSQNNTFLYVPLSLQEIDGMYAQDWLARKIVDIIPADMTREWRTWAAKQAEPMYATERAFYVRSRVKRALELERLYGGAAIMIGDGGANPAEPLDLERMGRGGLKYLHVFSKLDLSAEGVVKDVNSPYFGCPEFYRINTDRSGARVDQPLVHRSRFAFFRGSTPPESIAKAQNDGWGLSVLEIVHRTIVNVNAGAANAAALTEEAKIDVIKIPNLSKYFESPEATAKLVSRLTLAGAMKSNINTLVLGGEETFERKQISFAGIPDIIQTHLQIASGAADIPLTRLLGQSPAGMNATGESDIRNYYDKLRAYQNTDFMECLRPLDEALQRHTLGTFNPDEVNYEWTPLWQLSESERADITAKKVQAVKVLGETNLFAPEELRPSVADMLVDDQFLPSLDQNLLNEADFAAFLEGPDPSAVEGDLEDPAASGGSTPSAIPSKLRLVSSRDRRAAIRDAEPRTLYVSRRVLNADEILKWARSAGIDSGLLKASDLHVTIAYSKTPVDWFKVAGYGWNSTGRLVIDAGGPRQLERFGPNKDAIVLLFASTDLKWRWQEFVDAGASWDWPEYQPHISIAYDAENTINIEGIEAYNGRIVLGPEKFAEVDDNWKEKVTGDDRPFPFDDAAFEETEHPRGRGGKWVPKGEGEASTIAVELGNPEIDPSEVGFGKSKSKNVAFALAHIERLGFKGEEWKGGKSSSAAIYSNGVISINASHKFWADPVGNMKTNFESGWLSSDHPLHVVYHEIGHAKYAPGDNFLGGPYGPQGEIAATVSKYARRNPKEFVSEVYAGMQAGRKYSDEVMGVFRLHAKPRL